MCSSYILNHSRNISATNDRTFNNAMGKGLTDKMNRKQAIEILKKADKWVKDLESLKDETIIFMAQKEVEAIEALKQADTLKLAQGYFNQTSAICNTAYENNPDLFVSLLERIPAAGIKAENLIKYGDVAVTRTICDRYIRSLPKEEKPKDEVAEMDKAIIAEMKTQLDKNVGSQGMAIIHDTFNVVRGTGKTIARPVTDKLEFGETIKLEKKKKDGTIEVTEKPRYFVRYGVGAPVSEEK